MKIGLKLVPMKVLACDEAAQTLEVVAVIEVIEGAGMWRVSSELDKQDVLANTVFGGCVSTEAITMLPNEGLAKLLTFSSGMMLKAARVMAASKARADATMAAAAAAVATAAAAAAKAPAKCARTETQNEMRGTVQAENEARKRRGTTSRGLGVGEDSHRVCPRLGLSGACVPANFFMCACKEPTV